MKKRVSIDNPLALMYVEADFKDGQEYLAKDINSPKPKQIKKVLEQSLKRLKGKSVNLNGEEKGEKPEAPLFPRRCFSGSVSDSLG